MENNIDSIVSSLHYYKSGNSLDLGQNQLSGVTTIGLNGHSLSIDGSSNLLYDSNIIINNNNLAEYVSLDAWTGDASSNLNMNNYATLNAISYGISGSKSFTTTALNAPAFGMDELVTYPNPSLQSITFNNNVSGLQLHPATPTIVNSSATVTKNSNLTNVFDFRIELIISENYTLDPSSFYCLIDIYDSTGLSHGIWLRLNYNAFSVVGNTLTLYFNTAQLNSNIIVQNSLSSLLAQTTNDFTFMVYAYGDGLEANTNVYMQSCDVECEIVNETQTQPNVLFYNVNDSNSITSVNNESIPLIQLWNNVLLPLSSSTVVYTIILPDSYQTHLISVYIIGTTFCIKADFCVYMESQNSNAFPPYTSPFTASIMNSSISVQNVMNAVNTNFDNVTFVNNSNPRYVDVIIHTNGGSSRYHPDYCSGTVNIVSTINWNELNP